MTSNSLFLGQLAQTAKAGNTQAAKLLSTFKTFKTPAKTTAATPYANVNQSNTFGAININNAGASGGSSGGGGFSLLSLFGGGGASGATGGGGGGGDVRISQIYQPTSLVSTSISNATSNAYTTNVTNVTNTSNIVSSPFAGNTQATTPIVSVTPTIIPSQTTTQTSTPTASPDLSGSSASGGGGGTSATTMSWWQYLIIGGVAIVGIYYISQALKSRGGNSKGNFKKDLAKYAMMMG